MSHIIPYVTETVQPTWIALRLISLAQILNNPVANIFIKKAAASTVIQIICSFQTEQEVCRILNEKKYDFEEIAKHAVRFAVKLSYTGIESG